ncbi:MAG TPA: L-rhamnose mutarotase [Rhizomicrobium sp.]|jgi:L-rhamnose mutarotase|nr:L-rhamnose mutarotase [Rhizomicrobium sp.]
MRAGFTLNLNPDRIAEYEESHRAVWPEMLALLKDCGISRYSIFRRGTQLFLTFTCDDFEASWSRIEQSPVNARWQAAMAPFFAPMDDRQPGERFPMWQEVFYLD